MLWQMQMHLGVVFRFSMCLCLMGFSAAKCDPEMCGSMSVSYPFWINNSNCGYPGFQITCMKDNSTGMLAPFFYAFLGNYTDRFLPRHYYQIMKIDYTGHLFINSSSLKAQSCQGNTSKFFYLNEGRPFTISMSNRLLVVGCNTFGTYAYGSLGDVRCVSLCESDQSYPPYCRYGCCEVTVPDNWLWINFTGGGEFYVRNSTTNSTGYFCGFSTILDPSTFTIVDNSTSLFWGEGRKAYYGLRLNWGIGLQNCSTAKATANYSCSSNAECSDSPSGEGHVCTCLNGYEGNGYSNGTDCTDIDECSHEEWNKCVESLRGGICHNLPGSYNCSCAKGYKGDGYSTGIGCTDIDECSQTNLSMCVGVEEGGICHNSAGMVGSYNCSCTIGYKGDGFRNGTGCKRIPSLKSAIIGSVSSFVGVSLGACGLFWWLRRRRLKHARDENFRQNGGMQLQERIASMGGRRSLRTFSERELEIASNKYSTVLGRGGFATVYKGVLLDGTPVAIKKPKSISDEFINEIIILSHINHRNVVQLLGCCMETQFPLLVYEFVPNGTVYEHLHSAENELPWETRRQIAIETAEAIAYVHLQASQPIFHRDVKSSNILLDNTFTPKVADFGISRLRPWDERHLSTMLPSGTPGYVDPEFVRTNQFTDKSDVFSFGVVLVELLTGLTPLLSIQGSLYSLYEHFLSAVNDNRVTEILDPKVVKEENQAQMENMARLARACLQEKSRARPSMREVVEELAWIRAATKQPAIYRDVSLVEHRGDPKQAKLNYHALPTNCDTTSRNPTEDYCYPSQPDTSTSSESPSTALIQIEMSHTHGR